MGAADDVRVALTWGAAAPLVPPCLPGPGLHPARLVDDRLARLRLLERACERRVKRFAPFG